MATYRLKRSLKPAWDESPPVGTLAEVTEENWQVDSGTVYVIVTLPSKDYISEHRFFMSASGLAKYWEKVDP